MIKSSSKKVEEAITEFKERDERKLNINVHNVPEPLSNSENKKDDDLSNLKDIFKVTRCEVEVKEIIRMGKPGPKARLIKVKVGSLEDKHRILGGTRFLRQKQGDEYAHKWGSIFITPDQTKAEREKNQKLRKELERRRTDEDNINLVIFRGEIIERKAYAETGLNPGLGKQGSFHA